VIPLPNQQGERKKGITLSKTVEKLNAKLMYAAK